MKKEKTMIRGNIVEIDPVLDEAIRYLKFKITTKEAKVFFDEAYVHGRCEFRDHLGYHYRLTRNGGEYQITKI